jgi:ketosteroid isomerase-like protein
MAERSPQDVFDAYMNAVARRDWDALQSVTHPDLVVAYPQSGERIRGVANFRAILENYPGGLDALTLGDVRVVGAEDRWLMSPSFTVVHIVGSGDAYTGVASSRYPDGSEWYVVSLGKVKDGKLWRAETYFAPKFEAPEWRSQWVERFAGA